MEQSARIGRFLHADGRCCPVVVTPPPESSDRPLIEALASSQRLGMLGARPLHEVIAHAEAFVTALVDVRGVVVDIGSGGGVPGLIIARRRPDLQMVLADRRITRTDHLQRLVGRLGWSAHVRVITVDVFEVGGELGGVVDAVVARGFGPPQATLRAASALLADGGRLIVSEPPFEREGRWPADLSAWGMTRVRQDDVRVAVFLRAEGST